MTVPSATLRRVLLDWAPSVVLSLAAGHELLYNHSSLGTWLLVQSVAWVLVVRRLAPAPVLAVALALGLVGWWADQVSVGQLGTLVALHAVASEPSRRRALGAAVLVEAAAVLVSVRFAPAGSVNDAVVLLTGLVLSALLLGRSQQTQRAYVAQLEREREQEAVIAAAEERTRIAREIHDIVAHSVSVMIALSEGAAFTPDTDEARGTMRQVASTGREALHELRRVLSVLEPVAPGAEDGRAPQPTLAALPRLASDVRRAGLEVSLHVDPAAAGLPEAIQATAYRIVQESLTNTLKHAVHATRSTVRVAVEDRQVRVEVRDDGRPSAAAPHGGPGRGIRGMTERADTFGGTLRAGVQDDGWVVTATLERTLERTAGRTAGVAP